jgi:hypothetical protein
VARSFWQMLTCVDALMLQHGAGDVEVSPLAKGSDETSMSFENICHQAEDALSAAEAEFGTGPVQLSS